MLIAACDRRPDVGPVVVSAIGDAPALRDPARAAQRTGDRLLADSIAQGLVRFDAAGQIEPGIAERWIVIDDGTTYIFRLHDAAWPDGRPVTASEIVAILKRQIGPRARNPLAPWLTAIDTIVEMTPQVIQIELSRPRPDLLKLFAQPELAIAPPRAAGSGGGSGPFRIARRGSRSLLLTPVPDAARATDRQHERVPEENVRLIGERAARAITRFAARASDLVTGGTISDWPLLQASGVAPASIRLDPAAGLFGLAIARRDGFLATPENRAAIAAAIDRAALTATFTADWAPAEQLLPESLDSAAPPALPSWAPLDRAARLQTARAQVDAWRKAHPGPLTLRLAVPGGPGGTLLWGRIGADLRAIGITPLRAGPTDDRADLRLIDAVAPYDSARWYVAVACAPCGAAATAAIEAARTAVTPADRAAAIAAADAALAADAAFIPLARPLRWSLVSLRLRQWTPNPRAWHPLNRLRADTK